MSFIFKYCLLCNTIISKENRTFFKHICSDCLEEVESSLNRTLLGQNEDIILDSGKKVTVHSIFRYEDSAKSMLWQYKECGQREVSEFFKNYVERWAEEKNVVFIPLPASSKGLRERGYDQCKEILYSLNIPFIDVIELKKKRQRMQKNLNSKEREDASKNKYTFAKDYKRAFAEISDEEQIVLFDDVFTTGSSLKAAAELLNNSIFKDKNIGGLTLFRRDLMI